MDSGRVYRVRFSVCVRVGYAAQGFWWYSSKLGEFIYVRLSCMNTSKGPMHCRWGTPPKGGSVHCRHHP